MSGLEPLDVPLQDASALLRPSCAARASGEREGSFVVAQRRGLAASPEDLLLAFDAVGGGEGEIAAEDEELPPIAAGPPEIGTVQVAQVALSEGATAFRGGRFEEAEQHWTEAAEFAAQSGDAAAQSDALRGRAQSQQAQGQYDKSVAPLREALALAERSGDPVRMSAAASRAGDRRSRVGSTRRWFARRTLASP